MSAATDLIAQYAACHRDRRNIATHFVGIPLIVFAVGALLARPTLEVGGWPLTPAAAVWAAAALWYVTRGNLLLGTATALASLALVLAAMPLGQLELRAWLAWSVGAFLVGWGLQFAGHYYEGRRPAFMDDLRGLLVGPMFVTAEALFALGWGRPLAAEIERRVGPTYLRDLHAPAAR
ncbi:MAG TPA: Mpo1-like protein [Burkholderiaceae bacterium]|nr:Mpo1-like protein [Burkholderiaceae bacterium]